MYKNRQSSSRVGPSACMDLAIFGDIIILDFLSNKYYRCITALDEGIQ